MSDYKVPVRDIRFCLHEVLDYSARTAAIGGFEETGEELVDAIIDEAAKFCERELAPLNQPGDQQGCVWNDGVVTTPDGFKEAYANYVEGGWASLSADPEFGGQGLPPSMSTLVNEMSGSANWAWAMYPGLSHGAHSTIDAHGTEEQKNTYLNHLTSGQWTGTMCLTESHCGTDLGMLRTRAEPNDDGSYALHGTKIFISAGEHDMTENIVHIVLARLPDAPKGTRGISLFIVPKYLVNADGGVGERNGVNCGSIEHKMGIHGNATCVLNFDGAKGFLIGPPNRGLNCMFTFMNIARLGTAVQGLAHAEVGFQKSLAYARDRLQMRSLSGMKTPDKPADPIIVHPDVRRMLLTQKAFAEAGRLFIYSLAMDVDITQSDASDQDKGLADMRLALLTPIAKAFLTETGFESANLGLQIFGGHGFIKEWGMEQNVRDCRISMLYEGTTGIQALDLLGRKVVGSQGSLLRPFLEQIMSFCEQHEDNRDMANTVATLRQHANEWEQLTSRLGMRAMADADEIGAASVDYLMYSGYVVLAYLWARSQAVALQKLAADDCAEPDFYRAKLSTADFYYKRLLPRTRTLLETMEAGADSLMALDAEHFSF
jgi:alkylation response protein AidB-like acyl-CoA dehydrogenase